MKIDWKDIGSKALAVGKAVFQYRKLITVLLATVGLGAVSGAFGTITETVCIASPELCAG